MLYHLTWLLIKGQYFWTCKISYLSILLDDKADSFAASLLSSYCSRSSVILSSFVKISCYIRSERFFLKRKGLSGVIIPSITKKKKFAVYYYKNLRLNAICWSCCSFRMIIIKYYVEFSLIFFLEQQNKICGKNKRNVSFSTFTE